KKSIHGFFLGLQNCLAILHVTNPPIHGLFNFYQDRNTFLASEKSLLGFFLGAQIRRQICAPLTRHPWLFNFYQDRNTFLALKKTPRLGICLARKTRSLSLS
ncbi:MAG: hypothetical protein II516_08010, partial [Treponema sp.]|nr:hypothetical protein [Treponema sp.]